MWNWKMNIVDFICNNNRGFKTLVLVAMYYFVVKITDSMPDNFGLIEIITAFLKRAFALQQHTNHQLQLTIAYTYL
ncbi:MAG: hypothetical protein CFE24_05120 [Flavobacterium sp. BFFFF2]|nr:MAG: hypothetical protein CFE24_05120 [Flavobacterium sp. BFFFF2]